MEILTREKCNQCHGNCIISNPAWVCFDAVEHAGDYFSAAREYFGAEEDDELPPEEIPCPACDGSGYIQSWLRLGEVMLAAKEDY